MFTWYSAINALTCDVLGFSQLPKGLNCNFQLFLFVRCPFRLKYVTSNTHGYTTPVSFLPTLYILSHHFEEQHLLFLVLRSALCLQLSFLWPKPPTKDTFLHKNSIHYYGFLSSTSLANHNLPISNIQPLSLSIATTVTYRYRIEDLPLLYCATVFSFSSTSRTL